MSQFWVFNVGAPAFARAKQMSLTMILLTTLFACGGGGDSTTGTDGTDGGGGGNEFTILPPIRENGVVSGFEVASDTVVTVEPEPDPGRTEPDGGEFGGDVGEDGDGDGTGGGTGDGSISRENLRPPAPSADTLLGCRYPGLEAKRQFVQDIRVGRGTSRDGGVGIGGAPGQFKGVTVVVHYPGGAELGRAVVDDARGMVTVYPGVDYTGGLEITVLGARGATYFDPGTMRDEPFGERDFLRAYVSSIRGNIAVTPLTNAAAALVDNFRENTEYSAQALQGFFLRSNRDVGHAVSACLPAAFRIPDIARLPENVLTASTSESSLSNDRSGRHTAALAGLVKRTRSHIGENNGLLRPGDFRPMMRLAGHLVLDLADDDTFNIVLDGGVTPPDPDGNRPNQQPTLPVQDLMAYPSDRNFSSSLTSEVDSAWSAYGPINAPRVASVSADLTCKVTLTDGSPGIDQTRTFTYDPQDDVMSGISGGVLSVRAISEASDSELGDIRSARTNFVPFEPLSSGEFVSINQKSFGESTIRLPRLNAASFRVVARRDRNYKPTYYYKRRTIYPLGNQAEPAIDETFVCTPAN